MYHHGSHHQPISQEKLPSFETQFFIKWGDGYYHLTLVYEKLGLKRNLEKSVDYDTTCPQSINSYYFLPQSVPILDLQQSNNNKCDCTRTNNESQPEFPWLPPRLLSLKLANPNRWYNTIWKGIVNFKKLISNSCYLHGLKYGPGQSSF